MGNAWIIPSKMKFPTVRENATKPIVWESLENRYLYFSHSMRAFFPLDSQSMVYLIFLGMHGTPHQFPIVRENAAKLTVWSEPGKSVLLLFP